MLGSICSSRPLIPKRCETTRDPAESTLTLVFPSFVMGLPITIYHNFAPRVGIAWAPSFQNGFLRILFGDSGQSSIRASYGIFYTAFPGLAAGIMYGVPPYGYNYLSPQPSLFATPFINSADGAQNVDPFPLNFPPHNFPHRVLIRVSILRQSRPSVLLPTSTTGTPCRTQRTTCSPSSGKSRNRLS
jgi:hypothetical protein